MLNKLLKFNWVSFLSMIALVAIGIIFIKSAGEARTIASLQGAWRVHAATALFGLIIYFTVAFIDYRYSTTCDYYSQVYKCQCESWVLFYKSRVLLSRDDR